MPDLINSVHRPVGGRTSPRQKLGQPSSSSLSRIFEPKQAISKTDALAWPGLHVDKEQRSNYIQSLAMAFPYDRYDAHCTLLYGVVSGMAWQSRNPCVPNFGAAATPIKSWRCL